MAKASSVYLKLPRNVPTRNLHPPPAILAKWKKIAKIIILKVTSVCDVRFFFQFTVKSMKVQ